MKKELKFYLKAAFTHRTENVSFHTHNHTEFVFLNEGQCSVEIENSPKLKGVNGDLFILPAGLAHNKRSNTSTLTSCIAFNVSPEYFKDSPRVVHLQKNKWVRKWIFDLCELNDELKGDISDIGEGLLKSILCYLKNFEEKNANNKELNPFIVKVFELLDNNIDKPLTMIDVAEYAGISQSYLSAIFVKIYGIGPISYFQRMKLSYAERLMHNPYLTIEEIAYKCGYDNANYFSRLFKKKLQKTPTEFRKKLL